MKESDVSFEVDLRESRIPVVIAGLGVIGRQHARLLDSIDDFEIVGVCDANPETAATVGNEFNVPYFTDYNELAKLSAVAAVISLPTHLHYESSIRFLNAGLHVLVEKPIASTVAQAREMEELAKEKSKILLVGQVERFNAAVRALKHEILEGRLGDIVSVVTRRVGTARPAVPHANVALDLAIHDVDVLRYLLNVPGELVTSFGSTIGGNRMEDHVDLVLRYGETFCTVQANWITPVKIRRMSVTGTKGTAELDYIEQQVLIYEAVPQIIQGHPGNFFAVSQQSPAVSLDINKSEPLRAELQHFASCIRGERQPIVTAAEATDALMLVTTATQLTSV